MNEPLISVIVPVYKVEPYLKRCVNSIRNQTYRNLEIILVDDGSPDRCGEMCDAFAHEDSRIRVIHKENGGLSSARNAGLDVMTGDYVGFVDSDDWIDPHMYEVLYTQIEKNCARIAVCTIRCDFPNGELMSYFAGDNPTGNPIIVYQPRDALKELIRAKQISNSVCDKLFKRVVFAKRRFRLGIVNEDFDIMPYIIAENESIVYVPDPMYHYTITPNSITRGAFKESRFTETDISRKHIQYYAQNYPELTTAAVAKHVEIALGVIHQSWRVPQFAQRRQQLIDEVKLMSSAEVLSYLDKKIRIKYLVFRLNLYLYVWMMDLYTKLQKQA